MRVDWYWLTYWPAMASVVLPFIYGSWAWLVVFAFAGLNSLFEPELNQA